MEPGLPKSTARPLIVALPQSVHARASRFCERGDFIRTVEAVRAKVGDRMQIMIDAKPAQSPEDWQPGVLWALHLTN